MFSKQLEEIKSQQSKIQVLSSDLADANKKIRGLSLNPPEGISDEDKTFWKKYKDLSETHDLALFEHDKYKESAWNVEELLKEEISSLRAQLKEAKAQGAAASTEDLSQIKSMLAEVHKESSHQSMRLSQSIQQTNHIKSVVEGWSEFEPEVDPNQLPVIDETFVLDDEEEDEPGEGSGAPAASKPKDGKAEKTTKSSPSSGPLTTKLTREAKKGERRLEVESTSGFKKGQKIRIGRRVFEEALVVGFGSLLLDEELALDHDLGTPVVLVNSRSNLPDQVNSEDEADGDTNAKPMIKGKIRVPKLPTRKHEITDFHMDLMDSILIISTRTDQTEKKWVDQVLRDELSQEDLDSVPEKFVHVDRILRPALVEASRQFPSLYNDIRRRMRSLHEAGETISARRVLHMIYDHLATDNSLVEIVTLTNLTNHRYKNYGDGRAHEWWHDFQSIWHRLGIHIDDLHIRDLIYAQIVDTELFKIPLIPYNTLPKGERKLQGLLQIIERTLQDRKHALNLKRETREFDGRGRDRDTRKAHAGKLTDDDRSTSRQPVYHCEYCGGGHKTQNCRASSVERAAALKGHPKGKSQKGKGKDQKGKGKGKDQKGKGKGPGGKPGGPPGLGKPPMDKKKIPCTYFQTEFHGGKCELADCPFLHVKVKTQEEYDQLYKPWKSERSRSRSPSAAFVPKSPRDRSSSPGGGTKPPGRKASRSPVRK